MKPSLVHQLVGYDPITEHVAFEQDISSETWDRIKSLLAPEAADPDYVYAYPLERGLAGNVLSLVGIEPLRDLRYYIECSLEG